MTWLGILVVALLAAFVGGTGAMVVLRVRQGRKDLQGHRAHVAALARDDSGALLEFEDRAELAVHGFTVVCETVLRSADVASGPPPLLSRGGQVSLSVAPGGKPFRPVAIADADVRVFAQRLSQPFHSVTDTRLALWLEEPPAHDRPTAHAAAMRLVAVAKACQAPRYVLLSWLADPELPDRARRWGWLLDDFRATPEAQAAARAVLADPDPDLLGLAALALDEPQALTWAVHEQGMPEGLTARVVAARAVHPPTQAWLDALTGLAMDASPAVAQAILAAAQAWPEHLWPAVEVVCPRLPGLAKAQALRWLAARGQGAEVAWAALADGTDAGVWQAAQDAVSALVPRAEIVARALRRLPGLKGPELLNLVRLLGRHGDLSTLAALQALVDDGEIIVSLAIDPIRQREAGRQGSLAVVGDDAGGLALAEEDAP